LVNGGAWALSRLYEIGPSRVSNDWIEQELRRLGDDEHQTTSDLPVQYCDWIKREVRRNDQDQTTPGLLIFCVKGYGR
jgi:hypothetical protein